MRVSHFPCSSFLKTALIKKFRVKYSQSLSTIYKQRTISEIIQQCTRNGGRFLELRSKKGHDWVVLSDKRARRKVALAIQYRQRCFSPSSAANTPVDSAPTSCNAMVSPELGMKSVPPSYSMLDLAAVTRKAPSANIPPLRTSASWPRPGPSNSSMMAIRQLSYRIEEINGLLNELCSPTEVAFDQCYYTDPIPVGSSWHRHDAPASDPWGTSLVGDDCFSAALEPRPIRSPSSVRNMREFTPLSADKTFLPESPEEEVLLRHPVCLSPTPSVWDEDVSMKGDEDDLLFFHTFDL
jgi:hypothetical protein